ncbi:MAG: hypothetical protein Fur0046_21380 [Cyanobacteria bacterium J069]
MADNTEQFNWIVTIKENLEFLFAQVPNKQYGVEEYYIYDADKADLSGWLCTEAGQLDVIEDMAGWISPRFQIRFEMNRSLQIFRPDGQPFLGFGELETLQIQAEQRADQLAKQLSALGIEPESAS